MKLSLIKKCIIGSIMVLISTLGIGSVKAANHYDLTNFYNNDIVFGSSYSPNLTQEKLDIFIDYLNKHYDKFVVYVDMVKENDVYLFKCAKTYVYGPNETSANIYLYYGYMYPVYNNTFNAINVGAPNKSVDFHDITSTLQSYIDNNTALPYYYRNNWYTWASTGVNSSSFYSDSYINSEFPIPYYAKGIPVKFGNNTSGSSIIIGNTVYAPGVTIPTYLEYRQKIGLSKNQACDQDGIDNYIITADFERVFDTDLIYQIKIGEDDWQDITNQINENALNYGVYTYEYTTYFNTEFKARVLYPDGRVKSEGSISVTELNDFGFIISHAPGCDSAGRNINIVSVDLHSCWSNTYKYQYSYDNEKFYDINPEGKMFSLNHALNIPIFFRILDNENNVIYSLKYDADMPDLNKKVNFSESTNIADNEKQIILSIDFTEYLKFFDMYNFRIYVNGVEYDEQAFLLEFVYTKDNYVKAIDYQIYVDNLEIVNQSYRLGSQGTGGGGSDSDFDETYNDLLENELENDLGEQDLSTTEGMVNAIKNFLNAIKNYIILFFEWIMRFFNGLNIWLRTALVGEFVIMVICRIIKAVRK